MLVSEVQYITNKKGKPVAVILPIKTWERISQIDDSAYLNSSKKMIKRINQARERGSGLSLKEVHEKLGI
jgi:SH3-like domain-containing protein